MSARVCSLIYHDVVDAGAERSSGFVSADADFYKLPIDLFVRHLDAIARVRPGGPSRVDELGGAGAERFFLTFDDGGVAAIERTAGLLEERGWRGIFFVTTGRIGTPGFLADGQIRELAARGHRVGSHSVSHPPRFSHQPAEAIHAEWRESRARLEDVLGAAVKLASVPGGYYSREVAVGASRAGIEALWTSEPTTRPWRVDETLVLGRYGLQRIHEAAGVAALVAGTGLARPMQAISWGAKKALKRLGGRTWLAARERFFAAGARRDGPRS